MIYELLLCILAGGAGALAMSFVLWAFGYWRE